jgi:hypothetical protein
VTRCVYTSDAHDNEFEVFQVDTCKHMPRVSFDAFVADRPTLSSHGELCAVPQTLSMSAAAVVRSPCGSVQLHLCETTSSAYFALARSVCVVVGYDSMAVFPLSQ